MNSFAEDIMKDSKIQEKVQEYFKNYPLAEAYEEDDYEYLLEDKLESNLDVTVDIKKGTQGELKNGDKAELTDLSGNTVTYQVYDKKVIEPTDVSCTSQMVARDMQIRELTLITCTMGENRD